MEHPIGEIHLPILNETSIVKYIRWAFLAMQLLKMLNINIDLDIIDVIAHPEYPATEAQLSCPIALFGSPSPQLTN